MSVVFSSNLPSVFHHIAFSPFPSRSKIWSGLGVPFSRRVSFDSFNLENFPSSCLCFWDWHFWRILFSHIPDGFSQIELSSFCLCISSWLCRVRHSWPKYCKGDECLLGYPSLCTSPSCLLLGGVNLVIWSGCQQISPVSFSSVYRIKKRGDS